MERPLNLSKVTKTFFEEAMKSYMGRTLPCCYHCGICSSSCPVAEEMDIKPHEMVEVIKLGLKNTLAECKAIWQCSTCYMCTERCPQGVKPTDTVLSIRDARAERFALPVVLLTQLLGLCMGLSPEELGLNMNMVSADTILDFIE